MSEQPEMDLGARGMVRPPWWLVVLALLVLIWLGVRIVEHVTDTLTGTGGPPAPVGFSRDG